MLQIREYNTNCISDYLLRLRSVCMIHTFILQVYLIFLQNTF